MLTPDPITVTTPTGDEVRDLGAIEREREALDLLDGLHRESNEYRERSTSGQSLVNQWETNGHRFLGNHYVGGTDTNALVEGYRVFHFSADANSAGLLGLRKTTLNRVQTSVISNVAGQTQQEVVIRFSPQETDDTPVYWLSPKGGQLVAQYVGGLQATVQQAQAMATPQVDPMTGQVVETDPAMAQQASMAAQQAQGDPLFGVTPEQTLGDPQYGPIEPLTEDQGIAVQMMIGAGMLPENALIAVNDKLATDVAQEVFDHRWNMALGNPKIVMNEFLCNIFGHQPMRFQWDDRKHCFHLENPHVLNVWVDPNCDCIDDAEYLVFDRLMSVDKARATWPELAESFEKAGAEGSQGGDTVRHSATWSNLNYHRPMVVVRTGWIRHQMFPVSEEDAVAQGLVEPATVDVEGAIDPESGIPVLATQPMVGDDGRPIYQLPDGALTTPDNDNWPTEPAIREIVALPAISRVVRDDRCAYSDFPFGWNVNIPIPYSPYGQGEPQRLEDLQMQINRVLSIVGNHLAFYQAPQRYWRASTLESIKRHGFQIHSRPGAEVPIPDADYDRLVATGRMNITQDIPPIPVFYMDLLTMLLAEMDRMAGNVEVRQGVAPAGITSGKAIDSLRSEAMGPMSFKAKFTEWMVERLAKLGMESIVNWMPESEWQKLVNRYQLPVLRYIIGRIDPESMDVVCEVSTGRGTNREQDEQRAVQMYAGGAPGRILSRKTTMRKAGVSDPDAEAKQIDKEDRERMQMMAPPMPVEGQESQEQQEPQA